MKLASITLLALSILKQLGYSSALEEVSDGLSEAFMTRVVKAAAASELSKKPNEVIMKRQFSSEMVQIDYNETIDAGRDDAVFIKDKGQCFVAFQATTHYLSDILQNANLFSEDACRGKDCCEFRQGFYNAWATEYKDKLMDEIKACVEGCDESGPEPCLIIAGHSQGGAIATVASVELSTITSSYEVITFAAPPSLLTHPDKCKALDYKKHYRFGKGLYKPGKVQGGRSGLLFDLVSFAGPPLDDYYSVGEFLVLSSESDVSVAYMGSNYNERMGPRDHNDFLGDAHAMHTPKGHDWENTGYFQIVRDIRDSAVYPVPVDGFKNGSHCAKKEYGEFLCKSKKCQPTGFGGWRPKCVENNDIVATE